MNAGGDGPPQPETWFTAADIARERGVTRQAAWVWLRAVEVEYGAAVVLRKEKRLYITLHDLRLVEIARRPRGAQARTDKRIAALEAATRDLEAQVTAQARELSVTKSRVKLLEERLDRAERRSLGQNAVDAKRAHA